MLTVLQEDEAMMTDFETIFVVNPDENKKIEEKPVVKETKPKLVELLLIFDIDHVPGR